MISLFFYLAAMLLLLYTSVLYASTALAFLAFGGFLFLVIAYGYLLVLFFTLEAFATVPITLADLGNSAKIELNLNNKSLFPAARLVLYLAYENTLTGEHGQIKLNGIADNGRNTVLHTVIPARHCGKYRIWISRILIYDMTGIFRLPKRYRKHTELTVMPPLYDTTISVTPQTRHFIGESEQYGNTAGGTNASEILRIRPYQAGDRLYGIHWKLSAKLDELMVRDSPIPLGCPVVMFLELPKNYKKTDAFLSLACALSFAMVNQKCAHYITWYSNPENDITRVRVDSEESFYLFLTTLYHNAGKPDRKSPLPCNVSESYLEKYRAEPFITGIVVHPDLAVSIGETFRTSFTAKNLKQELSGVEFIV